MSKASINNEIILLRKYVSQAQLHIIRKLTRNAFKLREKKGSDAQKAKNQRKAERITAEILSIKKIKRDEFTKFALTNTFSLKKIVEDRNSEPLTRIMARIADHSNFKKKIDELKNKYPNYLEFLGPGRKKKAKLERKEKRKSKDVQNDENTLSNMNVLTDDVEDSEASVDESNESQENDSEIKTEAQINTNILNNIQPKSKSKIKTISNDKDIKKIKPLENNAVKEKAKSDKKLEKKEKTKIKESKKVQSSKINNLNKTKDTSKIISKQAIVKRFTDVIKDDMSSQNKEIVNDPDKQSIELEKEVDPFFVTNDGHKNYLSVVVPKSKQNDDEDDYDDHTSNTFKRKFSRQQNDKFFNKVPKFNNKSTFNSNKPNSKWQNQQNKTTFSEKSRKINRQYNDGERSCTKSYNNQSKTNFKDKSNENLHPSWEAKKKQQGISKQGFQGKKIVFSDDV